MHPHFTTQPGETFQLCGRKHVISYLADRQTTILSQIPTLSFKASIMAIR